MTIIGEYCDRAISGKTDNRPNFQRLIKDSEKGQFEAVIMYTLDRFARNRYDSAIYKAKLKKNGVKVYYAKQPMPDTPPKGADPNTLFFVKHCFGFVMNIEEVG